MKETYIAVYADNLQQNSKLKEALIEISCKSGRERRTEILRNSKDGTVWFNQTELTPDLWDEIEKTCRSEGGYYSWGWGNNNNEL